MPVMLREDSGNGSVDEPFQGFECDSTEGPKVEADDRHKLRECSDGGGEAVERDDS